MKDKTVLITGGTNGIGRSTAEQLARMGAQVIIVGRNAEKTARVAGEISAIAGGAQVDYLLADLSVQEQVRKLADTILTRYSRLDVLVNNAGAVFMQRQVSADGFEMTFALNHLAYFLLTNLLLDRLIASAPARIVNVSSVVQMAGQIYLDDLQLTRRYAGFKAYGQSKLANVLFTYELARRLQTRNVTVNALHPGVVATNFGLSNDGIFRPLFKLIQLFSIKPADGARTSVYLASSPEVEGVTGGYFSDCKAVRSSARSYNQDLARRLWELSAQMTGLSQTI